MPAADEVHLAHLGQSADVVIEVLLVFNHISVIPLHQPQILFWRYPLLLILGEEIGSTEVEFLRSHQILKVLQAREAPYLRVVWWFLLIEIGLDRHGEFLYFRVYCLAWTDRVLL